MKKINYIIVSLLLVGSFSFGYLNQFTRKPKVEKVEVEVIKELITTDTVYIDNIIEETIYVPKYITKIQKDTIKVEIIKEMVVEKEVEVIKEIYVDRVEKMIVEVPVTENKWFLGAGYQFDRDNYFSGTTISLLRQWKGDKMISFDIGLRNDLLDRETGISKLRPYIGGTIYFRIDR